MPGATSRKPFAKRREDGFATAFAVCHAISIAMTVVLPAPVAIFIASRRSPGFASSLAFTTCSRSQR